MGNSNLPDNINEALATGRLLRSYPVCYEIFQLVPTEQGYTLIKCCDDTYSNPEDAHKRIAEMKKESPNKYGRLTYIPIVF